MAERIFITIDKSDHLEHHGIKGQKWGIRRFQNEDGTWTSLGKKMRQVKEKRKEEAEKKKSIERAEAIAYGNPRLIKKYMNTMTNEELQKAIQRASLRSNVNRLDKESRLITNGNQAIKDVLGTVGSVVAIGAMGVTIYDTYDKLSKRADFLGVKMPMVKTFSGGK